MSEPINIAGLDKAEVLAALYNSSRQLGMGFMHIRGAEGMTVEEAATELRNATTKDHKGNDRIYFDYLHGRVMKSDLTRDEYHPDLYDRDNGKGAAANALAPLFAAKASAK